MFGTIVAGRLVQTNFEQVGATQYALTIPEADKINHIVVFLTGVQPFPENMGGAVYFSWPDPNSPPSWQLLGYISNVKPSAIYKIANLKVNNSTSSITFGIQQFAHNAQIGISIEPLPQLEQQTPAVATAPSTLQHFAEFSQKMLKNFFNYLTSFSLPANQQRQNEQYIPCSVVHQWYTQYEQRLAQNPHFWKS